MKNIFCQHDVWLDLSRYISCGGARLPLILTTSTSIWLLLLLSRALANFQVITSQVLWSCEQDTVSDWALIFPSHILSQLQGWHWCQKIQKNVSQINLLSFCATIELKLSNLQKIIKIEEKVIKNLCFLLVFWNLCNLSLILAKKNTKC